MNATTSIAGHIFTTLSRVDVSDHIEQKNGLSYIAWTFSYQTLMEYYPDNSYRLWEERYENGNVMVHCEVTINVGEQSVSRYMWLPVLNYSNKAVANPDAMQINTTRMRCLTKCISMFGLGAYIYAGESTPKADDAVVAPELVTAEQAKLLGDAVDHAGRDLAKLMKHYKVNKLSELTVAQFEQAYNACQKQIAQNAATEQQ